MVPHVAKGEMEVLSWLVWLDPLGSQRSLGPQEMETEREDGGMRAEARAVWPAATQHSLQKPKMTKSWRHPKFQKTQTSEDTWRLSQEKPR